MENTNTIGTIDEIQSVIYINRFRSCVTFATLVEAWVEVKNIVSRLRQLNDSLLGRKPSCAEKIENFSQKDHEALRKPKDDDEFYKLVDYLCDTVRGMPDEPRPIVKSEYSIPLYYQLASDTARIAYSIPLYYQLASDTARIAIVRDGERFAIVMTARFLNGDASDRISEWLSDHYGNEAVVEAPEEGYEADDTDLATEMDLTDLY